MWSRIDVAAMTARPLPFFKTKLREISNGMYLQYGWSLLHGLMVPKAHDRHNLQKSLNCAACISPEATAALMSPSPI